MHRELNRLMGVEDPGMSIQKLMDSTSTVHHGRHREDAVHSLGGVAVELAKRGQLTARNMEAANAHLLQDRLGDAINRALPIHGPMRKPFKDLVQAAMVQSLRRRRSR